MPVVSKERAEMRAKIAVIVSALLTLGLSWLWISLDTPHDLPEATYAIGEDGGRHEQRADSKRELSSRKPSPPNAGRTRTAPESGALESEVARSRSPSRRTRVSNERREPARRARGVDAGDRGGAFDDNYVALESEDFDRFKQLVDALSDSSQGTPGGDPIERDPALLHPEDVERLDLDGDRAISPWEIERARLRLARAENHPVKNDLGDGEYPVERGEYGRPEVEFDEVDTNGDDVFDVGEYYEFLRDMDLIIVALDVDGDGNISRDESGLSESDFAPLDRDKNGHLKPWEIRLAVARGALD
jgi:hypothetical protein